MEIDNQYPEKVKEYIQKFVFTLLFFERGYLYHYATPNLQIVHTY